MLKRLKPDFLNIPFSIGMIYVFCWLGFIKFSLVVFSTLGETIVSSPQVLLWNFTAFFQFLLTIIFLHQKPQMAWIFSLSMCLTFYFTSVSTFGFAISALLNYLVAPNDRIFFPKTLIAAIAFLFEAGKTIILLVSFRRK